MVIGPTQARVMLFSAVASSALFFSRAPVEAAEYSCCGNAANTGKPECSILHATEACPAGDSQCNPQGLYGKCCTNACFDPEG